MTRFQPARTRPSTLQIAIPALVGLALRLTLVLRFPAGAGDSAIYEELAQNWLGEHVYGIYYANGLTLSTIRTPGYPAFLAIIYQLFRRGNGAIVLAQAVL